MLQFTADCEPLELPAVAVHYYSDGAQPGDDIARGTGVEAGIDGLRRAARAQARASG